jgi:hypothetical protein
VHAQYGAFAGYEQQSDTERQIATETTVGTVTILVERQSQRWLFSTQGVTLGISVYL